MNNVEQTLLVLQDTVNAVECNVCKCKHEVSFKFDNEARAITYKFSDNTCDTFRRSVLDIVGKRIANEINENVTCIF